MRATRKRSAAVAAGVVALGLALALAGGAGRAQPPGAGGLGARLGQGLDDVGRGIRRGATEVTDTMRRGFESMRADVQRMTLPQRVYSRLHWDRALVASRIEVQVFRGNVVLLRGQVPDQAARLRAVDLASSTADVREVIDELVALDKTTVPPAGGTPVIVPSGESAVPTLPPPASARGKAATKAR